MGEGPEETELSLDDADTGDPDSAENVEDDSPISSRYFAYESCKVVSLVLMAASLYLATTAASVNNETDVATEFCLE